VVSNQGDGGTGAVVRAHGEGGTGAVVRAKLECVVVNAWIPKALVRTNRISTTTVIQLFIKYSSEYKYYYGEESIGHTGIVKRKTCTRDSTAACTPLSRLARASAKLSRTKVNAAMVGRQRY
jgi:hypothetical protein